MERGYAAIDGASRGNPGPSAVGYVISDRSGTIIAAEGRSIGIGTNNQAEYAALIAVLEKAHALGIRRVKVQTDSELLFRQVTGRYRVRHPALKLLFLRTIELIRRFDDFELAAVPREQNRTADALANRALNRSRPSRSP